MFCIWGGLTGGLFAAPRASSRRTPAGTAPLATSCGALVSRTAFACCCCASLPSVIVALSQRSAALARVAAGLALQRRRAPRLRSALPSPGSSGPPYADRRRLGRRFGVADRSRAFAGVLFASLMQHAETAVSIDGLAFVHGSASRSVGHGSTTSDGDTIRL